MNVKLSVGRLIYLPTIVWSQALGSDGENETLASSKGAVREHILKQIINHNVIYIFICIYVVCSCSYNILCNNV